VAIGLLIALGFLAVGPDQVLAALLGTTLVVIPNAIFARAVLGFERGRVSSNESPEVTVESVAISHSKALKTGRRILMQQFLKAGLTLLLLVIALGYLKPEPLGFFTALVGVQFAYVIGPLLFAPRRRVVG